MNRTYEESGILATRFKRDVGEPQTFTTSGDHILYTPTTGKRVRLRWILLYSDPDNTGKCVVNVKWSAGSKPGIYRCPFPPGYGAFGKTGIREPEAPDYTLVLNMSTNQTIYVNLAVEEY